MADLRCKKCLLQDFDEKTYKEKIEKIINLMEQSERTQEDEYNRRLDICRGCDRLQTGTCLACGCFVELRAAVRRNGCPYKKWADAQ